ncbi:MAG TPA: hypothetical protein VF469_30285 [Kofleriaceae bacterium]
MSAGKLSWSLVSQSAGFGNLLDGKHPIWIGDFTGAGHAQVMFYYSGDGNWWLGTMSQGTLHWSMEASTGLVEAHGPAMQVVGAIIGGEPVLEPVEREPRPGDPVGVATDQRAQVSGGVQLPIEIVEPEHHIARTAGAIGNIERHDRSAEAQDSRANAAGAFEREPRDHATIGKPAELVLVDRHLASIDQVANRSRASAGGRRSGPAERRIRTSRRRPWRTVRRWRFPGMPARSLR